MSDVAAVGVYALVSCQVALRRRELGIRQALGALPRALRFLVLRRSALLVAAGLTIGIGAGLVLGRFARSVLYETAPHDPLSFIALPVLLATVALGAAWLPSRRGAAVDPLSVLRTE
ncbi:MAG TPA: FtsX-like permease family protein [Longimicrobiales bacterium]|nr:FtsX-like permease family protein [Longimicrobiales bacterium]